MHFEIKLSSCFRIFGTAKLELATAELSGPSEKKHSIRSKEESPSDILGLSACVVYYTRHRSRECKRTIPTACREQKQYTLARHGVTRHAQHSAKTFIAASN
mmetsp:Transcript_18479/g.25695  ORF Transcript_18479/g.25695 Transcript_18479/m.25695 type:complete len:102 (-) Transcript_18479:15-320(-)